MLDFYNIVKSNLSFNRFQFEDTVCLEYTCPIEAQQIGIFSKYDYVVHVLSGKKTYKTIDGEWTLTPGQTLYMKKGAENITQYFDDEYCMLGFFLSDDLIRETIREVRGKVILKASAESLEKTSVNVETTAFLEGYFHSMLMYFRGENRPPDHIMLLKLKELIITLMNSDPVLTKYFCSLADCDKPPLRAIMEKNFCYNLKLEEFADLAHRSLSSFKREFKDIYDETPGRWLVKRRVEHAAKLIINSSMSISQVAYDSGFEDLSHFSRVFKEIIGHSPSEYKQFSGV